MSQKKSDLDVKLVKQAQEAVRKDQEARAKAAGAALKQLLEHFNVSLVAEPKFTGLGNGVFGVTYTIGLVPNPPKDEDVESEGA